MIKRIKEVASLLDIVSGSRKLKRVGTGAFRSDPCPFCKHKGCFTIYESSYFCYSCKEGGDVIDYVQKVMNVSFDGAIRWLCEKYNIPYEKRDQETSIKRERLYKIFETASQYYHSSLKKNKQSLTYLRNDRRRSHSMINKKRYGYSDGSLHFHLSEKGFSEEEVIKSGLVRKKNGKIYDFFAAGLFIYPVVNYGKVVDFFCKDYHQKDKSRRKDYQLPVNYKLNNPVFYNKNNLYKSEYVLCEGPEDANSLEQYGIDAVAILGQLSNDQINFMQKHLPAKMLLAFDPDDGGDTYRKKILDSLFGKTNVRQLMWNFNAGDIDDFLRSHDYKEGVIDLKDSRDAVLYEMERLPEDLAEMDPQTQKEHYEKILNWVNKTDNLLQTSYIEQLAKKLNPKSKTKYVKALEREIKVSSSEERDKSEEKGSGTSDVYSPLIRKDRYYWSTPNGMVRDISNFVLEIEGVVEIGEEVSYQVKLRNMKGEVRNLILDKNARVVGREFKKAVASKGNFYYKGTDNELPFIWEYEEDRSADKPKMVCYQRVGWISEKKMWLFRDSAIKDGKFYSGKDGKVKVEDEYFQIMNVNTYGGDLPKVDRPVAENMIPEIVEHFWQMMDSRLIDSGQTPELKKPVPLSFRAFLMLGYMAALVYLPEIEERDGRFPYLHVFGPSETGKSEAVKKFMHLLGFRKTGENWGEATAAGIGQAMEQLSCLPYWLEEYKNYANNSSRQQKKIELINNVYLRTGSGKGGLNGIRTTREVNGTLLFTGQDRPEDKAFLSRCVVVRKEDPTILGTESYDWLTDHAEELSGIFSWLLTHKDQESVELLFENYKTIKKYIETELKRGEIKLKRRGIGNYAILAAAFSMLSYHHYDKEFLNWIVEDLKEDDDRKAQEDVVFRFFNHVEYCVEDILDVVNFEGNFVFMAFGKMHHEYVKEAQRTGVKEYLSENAFREYLRQDSRGYWRELNDNRRTIGGKRYRVICLKIDKMPSDMAHIVEGWRRDNNYE